MGEICQGLSQCDPTHVQSPKKFDLAAGGPHFKVDIRASASSALHGELRTQPLTARSRQNTKEVEDCMSSSNLLRVLGKCLGSVRTCGMHWLR